MKEVSYFIKSYNFFIAVRKLDKFKYLDYNKTLSTLYRKTIRNNTNPKNYENVKLYKIGTGL